MYFSKKCEYYDITESTRIKSTRDRAWKRQRSTFKTICRPTLTETMFSYHFWDPYNYTCEFRKRRTNEMRTRCVFWKTKHCLSKEEAFPQPKSIHGATVRKHCFFSPAFSVVRNNLSCQVFENNLKYTYRKLVLLLGWHCPYSILGK